MGKNNVAIATDIVHAGQSVIKPSQFLIFGVLGCFAVSVGSCCTRFGGKLRTD